IMIYILQTIVYAFLMYIIYIGILKDKPVHRFNRIYLLISIILPFLLPFIKLSFLSNNDSLITQYLSLRLPEITITDAEMQVQTNNWLWMAAWVYIIISISFLIYHLYRFWSLKKFICRAEKEKYNEYTLVKNTEHGPGSWGKYIFIPGKEIDQNIL